MDRKTHYAAASERIKYALATSALLSADLRDALQLYPPLHPPPPPPSARTAARRRAAPLQATVEWPHGWHQAGSLVDNAFHAWSALVNSLTLTGPPPQAPTPSPAAAPENTLARPARDRTAQEAATAAVNRFVAAAQHLDLEIAAALSAIKRLECIAHGSDPLPPISRIEARSYSHLLLIDAASSSSSSSAPGATTSTPTAATRRRHPRPRPLRALALRRALARALDETLAVLERATADLNALLPRDSPLLDLVPTKNPPPSSSSARSPFLPLDSSDSSNSDSDSEERESANGNDAGGGSDDTDGRKTRRGRRQSAAGGASIAEMLRHDERARRERDELDKFNNNNHETGEEVEEGLSALDVVAADQRTSSSFSGHDPATAAMADPYHPTENTFGGIERRRHASLNSPAAAVRLRDSQLSSASPLRRSQHGQRQSSSLSLSPRVEGEGPSSASSLEEEIIAAAARDARQVEGQQGALVVDPPAAAAAAAEPSTRMMMVTPSRGGAPPPPPPPPPPRFSTSSVATPPSSDEAWKRRSRSRRPVSLGGVSATPSLRRVLSVQNSSSGGGGGGGGRSARGAEEEEEEEKQESNAASVAESSKSPSPSSSSSSSSKSRRSGSSPLPDPPPLSATSSSPSPDPARLPSTTTTTTTTSTATTVVPLLLVSLQDTFDDLHALRRGVIWRLLEALSGAESDRNWNALAGVVGGGLAERLEEIAKEVEGAQERESFGGGGGGGGGGSSAADVRAQEMERRKEREKRRRSGAYARELLDDAVGGSDVVVDDEVEEENVFRDAGRAGELATSSRRDALARLTAGGTSTPPSLSRLDNKATKQNRRAPASYADFAPPSSSSAVAFPSSAEDSADPDLVAHARSMALALRAIEAKLRLVVDEVAHFSPPGDDHDDDGGKRRRLSAVVEMYRGIGVELKRLEEQWRIGGEVLERAAGLVQPVEREMPTSSSEDAEAEPSIAVRDVGGSAGQEDKEGYRNQLGAEDAVLQTEPNDGTGEEEDPIASRQALVDAALSASLLIPPSAPAEEKVFEAVAGPVRSTSSDGGSNKFSREERIRRMKEAREALARGRESLESSPVKTRTDSASADADVGSPLGSRSGGGSSSSLAQQQKMVGELQEVLREYNRERGRNVGESDTAGAVSTPWTPTKTTTTTSALPPLSLPPPPPVPFPVAGPIAASSPPPRPTFALPPPPPPPPPAHRQPVTVTSTSPQKALPQTPPRNAISPVTGLRGRPTPPPVQSPLGQKGTPSSSSGKRYSVQSV